MRWTRLSLAALLAAAIASIPSTVTTQVTPLRFDQGPNGLGLALRQLPVEGSVLYVTAHPDDENNGVLVALNRGRGLKTSLLTVTRGDGGQNEIGPELFQAIGILRAEELAGVHEYDGADQYFTRAYEFGYSFSVEETFEKWGKDEILRDVVRVMRRVRPGRDADDEPRRRRRRAASHGVGAAGARGVSRGGRSGALPGADQGRPAAVAGAEGVSGGRLWRRRRRRGGDRPRASHAVRVPTGDFDPLLGMSWAQSGQIGARVPPVPGHGAARSVPGRAGGSLLALRQRARGRRHEKPTSWTASTRRSRRLARFAGRRGIAGPVACTPISRPSTPPRAKRSTRSTCARRTRRCRRSRGPHARAPAARRGGGKHAHGRRRKPSSSWRLDRKARDFMKALAARAGTRASTSLAADGNVVRGQTFDVAAQLFNTGPEPMTLDAVAAQRAERLDRDAAGRCSQAGSPTTSRRRSSTT